MEHIVERKDFGVLYGQKTTEDALLIYSSYEDAKASPKLGDFIVLSPKNESSPKYLARVEAEVYDEDPLFLSDEQVRSSANPFVRVAKEGRKFGIGLLAITQRPSAISEEIRSQAENFFAFYMGNTDDIRALVKSNINYDGVIGSFVQRETI